MTTELTTTQQLNSLMDNTKVKSMFENALGENANAFVAGMIELVANDNSLQKCNPNAIMTECLKSAVLKLPINKSLGFSWIIAYKGVPTFQLGKAGIVQLALRTGKYKTIHSGSLYEGMTVEQNFLTGEVKISGEPTSDNIIGFFSHFELINGFKKSLFWTKKRMTAHAKKYSKSYNRASSPWKTEFPEMAKGTILARLLKKYGILSTEMSTAFSGENIATLSPTGQLHQDIKEHANSGDVIDIGKGKQPEQQETPPDQEESAQREPDFMRGQ